MKSVAAGLDLPEEAKKEAVLQPELLKGHLIELKYWVDKGAFSEYVSKRTKDTYPGGKVERELEEVCDTTDDFLRIAKQKR